MLVRELRKHTGPDQAVLFARNLSYQEVQRWAEYLESGTRESLGAWRAIRLQLRKMRAAWQT
jgi:hypothetical protein